MKLCYFFVPYTYNFIFCKVFYMTLRLILLLILILYSNILAASAIAIGHAPIGVMADHFHKKGEWMVSLRVTNMEMKKNILNGKSISNDEVLKQPNPCLLYTSPSPRDGLLSRMPSSA